MADQSPSRTLVKTLLGQYADASGDLDLRVFVGTPGSRIEVRNETVDTGQGYVTPGFLDGLLLGIGLMMDRRAKDEFEVVDPLGQTEFMLSQFPRSSALLMVFKNGSALSAADYVLSGKVVSTVGVFGDKFLFTYWY